MRPWNGRVFFVPPSLLSDRALAYIHPDMPQKLLTPPTFDVDTLPWVGTLAPCVKLSSNRLSATLTEPN